MSVRPLLLPDTASVAGYDQIDPISQWFLGGSGTAGATATGISDDERYGLDLQNNGSGGQSLRATSGNNSYQLKVDNSGITLVGGLGVTGTTTFYSPVVMNSTLSATGAATFHGAASFNGNVTLGSDTGDTITVKGPLYTESDMNFGNSSGDNAYFAGNVTVTGTASFLGLATVGGDLDVTGELSVDGNVTIGTDNSDRLDVNAQASFKDDVLVGDGVNDRLLVRGGTDGLQIAYDNSTATGIFSLGATNASNPSLLFKDNTGATVFTLSPQSSAYQVVVTGASHFLGSITVTGAGISVSGGSSVFNEAVSITNNGLTVAEGISVTSGGIGVTGSSLFSSALTLQGNVTLQSGAIIDFDAGSGAGFTEDGWSGYITARHDGNTIYIPYLSTAP